MLSLHAAPLVDCHVPLSPACRWRGPCLTPCTLWLTQISSHDAKNAVCQKDTSREAEQGSYARLNRTSPRTAIMATKAPASTPRSSPNPTYVRLPWPNLQHQPRPDHQLLQLPHQRHPKSQRESKPGSSPRPHHVRGQPLRGLEPHNPPPPGSCKWGCSTSLPPAQLWCQPSFSRCHYLLHTTLSRLHGWCSRSGQSSSRFKRRSQQEEQRQQHPGHPFIRYPPPSCSSSQAC